MTESFKFGASEVICVKIVIGHIRVITALQNRDVKGESDDWLPLV